MNETQILRAKALAERVHANQTDKIGADYIGHPARVAARIPQVPGFAELDPNTYYKLLAADPIARIVKIADLADNRNDMRMQALTPDVRGRLQDKYAKADVSLALTHAEVDWLRDDAKKNYS